MSEKSNSEYNYENSNPNSNDPEEPIYVMTLELEKGRSEQIKIYGDSDANELAYAFCKEHDLDFSALEYLKERIDVLLTQIRERTESQESQIEEVEDEHTMTEDNKITEQEQSSVFKNKHQEKEIKKDSDNNNEFEKERRLQPKKQYNAQFASNKTEDNKREEQIILEKENKTQNLKVNINKLDDNNNYSNDNNNDEEENNEDNIDDYEQNEQEDNEESENNNCYYEEEEQVNKSEEKEIEIHNYVNINNSVENNKNIINDNQQTKEKIKEIIQSDQEDHLQEKTEDPYNDPMNQDLIELDEENEPMLIKINDIKEQKTNEESNNKKEMKQHKIASLKPLSSIIDEKKEVAYKKNEKNQTISSTSKFSSSNYKEQTQHKNYFRAAKPIFEQRIQSTTNTKPHTQTEQKSTSHSPPQSNTTNPTIQNYYSIKSSIKTPTNDQDQNKNHVPSTNINSDKDEEERLTIQTNYINLHRYYSYWTKKASHNNNIFDRLFQDAELKRIIPTHHHDYSMQRQNSYSSKKSLEKQLKNQYEPTDKPSNMNYGEYLYTKDKIVKEEKEKQISQIKQYQEQQEIHSFKPIISEYKMNSINSSKRIDRNERIKKELSEVYTFKPKINKNYNTELTFNERQDFFTNLYKQRNQELHKYIYSNQDENGNLLFYPQLISKQNDNQISEINIFDKNYNYAYKYKKNKEELSGKIYKDKHIKPSNKESNKIITNIHNEVFGKLFNELNNGEDSQITPINLNTKTISKEIIKIIKPLLTELREDNQTLDKDEFISAMEQLFKEISVVQQRILINQYRNISSKSKRNVAISNNANTYKPIINSNTSKLASRHDNKLTEKYRGLIGKKNENVNRENYFRIQPKRPLDTYQSFSTIHNYTFDNYVKNLN